MSVTFQIWCATNLGTTKVFQTKSAIGSDLDNPGTKTATVLQERDGFVQVELLLSDTETIGTTSLTTPPQNCFGYIKITGGERYYLDKVATFNSNSGKVYVAGHSSLATLA